MHQINCIIYCTVCVLEFRTLYSILFWPKFCFFMQLFLKILSGMANSVDPDQTAPSVRSSLIWICTVCLCHFVRHFGVRNFRTFIVYYYWLEFMLYRFRFNLPWKHIVYSCAHWWWSQCQDCQSCAAFDRLRGSIWDRSGIRLDTKLKIYRSVVLPTLLYACETWTVYQRYAKRLNHFYTNCLRKLLKIKWQDRIPDTEVLKRAGMQSVHTLLKLAQLRWTGHVTRMPDERLPKKILYGELQIGNAPMAVRRSETRTHSKLPLKISIYQQSRGYRSHRIEQSGEAS